MDRLTRLYRLRAQIDHEIEAEKRTQARVERARPHIPKPTSPLPDVSRVPAAVIREWARCNDIEVPNVGRLPEDVRHAYARACKSDPRMLFASV